MLHKMYVNEELLQFRQDCHVIYFAATCQELEFLGMSSLDSQLLPTLAVGTVDRFDGADQTPWTLDRILYRTMWTKRKQNHLFQNKTYVTRDENALRLVHIDLLSVKNKQTNYIPQ